MQKALPKGWKMVKLGEVCEVVSGFGFPLEHQGESNQEIPFYKVSDMNLHGNEKEMIKHNNSLSMEKVATLKYKIYPSNTIIFPKIGAAIATNKKRLLTMPSIFDNNVMGLVPSDSVSFSFLYYWIQGVNISSWASESQPPSIRKSTVENHKLPLPPLPTQHKIVEILEEADNLRKLRQQADEKMKDLIPSLFVQMFGDPVKNPKGWEVKKLGEICELNPSIPRVPDDLWVSFIPMSAVTDNGKIIEHQSRQYYEVKKGYTGFLEKDVLFAKITPCMENGKGAIAKKLINSVGFGSTEFHVVRPNNFITPEFVFTYLSFHTIRKLAEQNMTGSAGQKRVSEHFLKNLKIHLPPFSLQQEFAKLVEDIEAEKARQTESRKKLDELFNSLMQRAFTGELAV